MLPEIMVEQFHKKEIEKLYHDVGMDYDREKTRPRLVRDLLGKPSRPPYSDV